MDSEDKLPNIADSLVFSMDGVVQECMVLHDIPEIEASFLAILFNLEGFVMNLIDVWQEQGSQDSITVGAQVIEGLMQTISWANEKAENLVVFKDAQ